MSRSGYVDDCDGWDLIRWRGAVKSAIRGKRGQALLRELADAMDAMPVKELVAHEFQVDGSFCALGVVGAKRGIPENEMQDLVDCESHEVAQTFDIAHALAAEIMHINDNSGDYWNRNKQTSESVRLDHEKRWCDVRAWVANQITRSDPT